MSINLFDGNDDLRKEIQLDSEGKVSMTRYALAKLIGVRADYLGARISQKLAERLASAGFDLGAQKLNEVAVTLILEYFAYDAQSLSSQARQLFRAMSAVGVRAFFQQQLGYMQEQPVRSIASLRQSIEEASKYVDMLEFAADKPGEKNIMEYATDPNEPPALPGYLTLKQMVEALSPGLSTQLDVGDWKHIGSFAAITHRNIYGVAPRTAYEKRSGKSGSYYPKVPVYPTDFMPYLRNVLELGYIS